MYSRKNGGSKIEPWGTSSLKPMSAIFYQIFVSSPNDSPLKTMKNAYFI